MVVWWKKGVVVHFILAFFELTLSGVGGVYNDWCYTKPSNGTFELIEDCGLGEAVAVSPYVNDLSRLEIKGVLQEPFFALPRIYREELSRTDHLHRLFTVVDAVLVLRRLNLTNGNVGPAENGGAVYVSGMYSQFEVYASVFHQNRGKPRGETIYAIAGSQVLINDTTIEGSSSDADVGGFGCHGQGTNCTVRKNEVMVNDVYDGASIHSSFSARVRIQGLFTVSGPGCDSGAVECDGGHSTTPCLIRQKQLEAVGKSDAPRTVMPRCHCEIYC
jgi:hypothetical protein